MAMGDALRREASVETLREDPERLVQLIQEADDGLLENLAGLMPSLGGPGARMALSLCGAEDTAPRERAAALLERTVASIAARGPAGSSSGAMPPRYGYVLLDALIEAPLEPGTKVELILRFLGSATDEGLLALLANLLPCWPDEAFSRLMDRFSAAARPEDLFQPPDYLYALCRMGARFAEALLPMLEADDARVVRLALAGVEALARAREPEWLQGASALHYANEVRTRRKWAPLDAGRLPQVLVDELAARAARLTEADSTAVRESALRTLGLLKAAQHRDAVARCAVHADVATRVAALVALGDIGGDGSVDLAMNAAASAEAVERRAAVELLGRLKPGDASALLATLLNDPDAGVRVAAISALGEIGGDGARALLDALLRSGDRNAAKAASKALYGGRKPGRTESAIGRERRERAGMASKPFVNISVDAAFRFALPEIRDYGHKELTERFAAVCGDFSATRRYAVEEGLLDRAADTYTFTELGKAVWRVERFILDRYLEK